MLHEVFFFSFHRRSLASLLLPASSPKTKKMCLQTKAQHENEGKILSGNDEIHFVSLCVLCDSEILESLTVRKYSDPQHRSQFLLHALNQFVLLTAAVCAGEGQSLHTRNNVLTLQLPH
jgi:hypothetical protein